MFTPIRPLPSYTFSDIFMQIGEYNEQIGLSIIG